MPDLLPVRARFSPGPWWGFNGVVQLSVTDDHLVIRPVGGWKAGGRTERRVPLAQVRLVSRRTRRGLFGRPDVVTAKLTIGTDTSTYTAKNFAGAVRVLDALPR